MKYKFLPIKKALKSVLLILLLSMAGMTKGSAYDFSAVCETGQTLYYNITDSTNHYVALTYPGEFNSFWTGFTYPADDLVIPDNVQFEGVAYTVTSIGDFALYQCNGLTSISIGNFVTSVGKSSFSFCTNLISISLGDAVSSIDNFAFYGSSNLPTITIPNSVTSIGKTAFRECESLTSITIGNSLASIGDDAFYNCNNLNAVYFTGDIQQWCNIQFSNYKSNPIYFAHNLYIGDELVTDLLIPETVTEIKPYAFDSDTCLTLVTISNSVTSISTCAFRDCNGLTGSLTIPNSVTSIGNAAFSGCIGLDSFIIGNSVTSIGSNAFYGCTGLTGSLVIPNSVSSIGGSAFSGCSGLTSLTLGNSIASIGSFAFSGCSSLNEVFYTGDIQQWCNIQFSYTNSNPLQVAHNLFIDDELITDLLIPNTVTEIKPYAFCGANCITSLTIPNSVTSISDWAFSSCLGMTSVTLGNAVTSIGGYAFNNCHNILSITSFAETPPSASTSSFYDVTKTIPFCVPCGFEDAYISLSWGGFNNFHGMCGGTVVVTANPEEGMVTGGGTFGAGQTCTVTATAMEGYAFAKWTLNGVIISNRPEYTFYVTGNMTLMAHFVQDDNVVFADSIVKSICVSHWDTNGDGELSYSEAASVLSLEDYFKQNSEITSFDELQYFIGLSSIKGSAFYHCSELTSITLPNSVISIGGWAFYDCISLTGISIGNSVISIGECAFRSCSGLTGPLVIPNSVTSIEYAAFQDCSGLTSLTLGNSITLIDRFAFYYCTGLTGSLTLPNSLTTIGTQAFGNCSGFTGDLTIPDSVTTIGSNAFQNCSGLTSLTIGNSVSSIGGYAFRGCSGLTSLTIGSSVTSIGSYAFQSCTELDYIHVLAETPPSLGENAFGYSFPNIPVYVPCGTVEDYQAASGWSRFSIIIGTCSGEVSVTVNPLEGGMVTGAGYYTGGELCVLTATPNEGFAFVNWKENGRIASTDSVYTFPAHPATIVANFCSNSPIAFADTIVKALCVANWDTNGDGELSYAEAAAVTDLGQVFQYKSTITSFDELQYFINLTSIGSSAFYDCTSLTSLEIPNSVTSIGSSAFYNCTSLTSVEIPNSVTSIGSSAFYDCTSLTSLEIPNSVTSIGSSAFYNCTSLTSVEIPNSVTSIGSFAFYNCTSLTSVEIPNSVTSIGGYAFINCINLEQIVVASGNTIYDSRGNCNAIIETATNTLLLGCKNTVIPYSVTEIGDSAFEGCTGLTTIVLPSSVTSINDGAFFGCSGLTAVYYTGDVSQWCNIQFADFWVDWWDDFFEREGGLIGTGIGESNPLFHAHNLYIDNELVTDLVIPETVTEIKPWTFIDATCLTSLTIGSSVTNIGDGAFYGCNGLTSMTVLADNPPTITSNTFQNVPKSIPVYVPCGSVEAYQSATYWSQFTNYQEMHCPAEVHFITSGAWSEPSNWSEGALPYANDIVFIDAPCQLDTVVEVANLTITAGQSLTLQAGKTLTVTGTLTNTAVSGLIIEDSAQLIHNNGVQATIKKIIAGHGTGEDKWYFITNPITDSIIPATSNGLLSNNYDLYYCYPTSADRLEWRNYKSNAFALHNSEGYLYANETGTELSFGGILKPSNSSVMRTVYYEENNNSPGNGWTLLGNPFACNCYLVDAEGNPLTIYKMNSDGTGLVEVLSGPVAPMEGFFYYTTQTQNVYFSRTASAGLSK